jgi:uncharacterized protein
MSLFDTIDADLITALKNRDQERVSTLRMLSAALKNKRIELQKDLEEPEVLATVKSQIKQLKDSLASFEQGERADLAEKAKAELEVLNKYMPEAMGTEELEALVKSAIEETDAAGMADMGKVMGSVMGKVDGKADGNDVKEVAQKLLS